VFIYLPENYYFNTQVYHTKENLGEKMSAGITALLVGVFFVVLFLQIFTVKGAVKDAKTKDKK
jgi:hypothetical protein